MIGGDPDLDNQIASMDGAQRRITDSISGKRELRDAAYTGSDRDWDMADLIERIIETVDVG